MALQYQDITVPLSGGLDTKAAKIVTPHGRLHRLENAIQIKTGEIRKRNGYKRLSKDVYGAGSSITSGRGLFFDGNGPLLVTQDRAYAFSHAANSWIDKGKFSPLSISAVSVTSRMRTSTAADASFDMCANDRYIMVVWQDLISSTTYSAYCSIIDKKTMVEVESESILVSSSTAGLHPKCISTGNALIAVYRAGSAAANTLYAKAYNTDSMSFGSVQTLSTTVATGIHTCEALRNGKFVVGYKHSATSDTTITGFNSDFTSIATHTIVRTAGPGCLSLLYDSVANVLYVIDAENATQTYVSGLNESITAVFAATSIGLGDDAASASGCFTDSGQGTARFFTYDATNGIKTFTVTSAGSVSALATVTAEPSISIASGAVRIAGSVYVMAQYEGQESYDLQNKIMMLSTDGDLVGQIFSGEAVRFQVGYRGNVRGENDDSFMFVVARRGPPHELGIADASSMATLHIVTASMATEQPSSIVHNGTLLVAGGMLYRYDGNNICEAGFALYPDGVVGSAQAGGAMTLGDHTVKAIYASVDDRGNIERSTPSEEKTVTLAGGNQTVRLVVPAPEVTGKTNVYVRCYVTAIGGSVFYFANESLNVAGTSGDVTVNNVIVDSTLTGEPAIYTDGGVLPSVSPPPPHIITTDAVRAYVVPADKRTRVWVGKPFEENVLPEFSDETILELPDGGDIVALFEQDGVMVVGKSRRLQMFGGQGPNALGQGSFSAAVDISTELGVRSKNSVVKTSSGTMFQSHKGIYLLDRSRQAQFIGAAVDDYNDRNIVASTMVGDKNLALFVLDSGDVLAWDTTHGVWGVYTGTDAVSVASSEIGGDHALMRADGSVLAASDGFMDDSRSYGMRIATGWFNFAGLHGYQRVPTVGLIGEYRSPHVMVIDVYTDGSDTPSETITVDSSKIQTTIGGLYSFRFKPRVQKCRSIKLDIRDENRSGSCESFRLNALTFRVASVGGVDRRSSIGG